MSDRHSISATTAAERTSSAPHVALIWLAATMTASSLPVGVLIAQLFPLAPFLWVVLLASTLFAAVGILSIPGFVYGIPTMAVSARVFGKPVNKLISLSNWLSQLGWQAVVLVLVVYILRSVFDSYGLVPANSSIYYALVLAILGNFVVPIIGYKAIVTAQTVGALFLALFAIAILVYLHGGQALPMLSAVGHFDGIQTLGGISLALMGGAFSWTMFASDYSRYVRRDTSLTKMALWPSLGGFAGGSLILALAITLYVHGGIQVGPAGLTIMATGLGTSALYLGFCTFAILGLLASNFLNSYSSAFSLAVVVGKDLDRKKVTVLDALLATLVGIYMLFVAPSFWDSFQTFLDLLIIVAAPWTGVMIMYVLWDVLPEARGGLSRLPHGRANVWVLAIGVAVTVLFSNNPLWEGYGAHLLHGIDISPLAGVATTIVVSASYRILFGHNAATDEQGRMKALSKAAVSKVPD
ncbi:cytosine permease [Acidithiobacillus sp.]|uniref:purine-cytosine permease family protein n=1 Tax=Acidithiobacillus sp. TaxID=1872118 RepID=UPI00260C5B89|nr:cytosine permease [Acidithiobacillus sp.]